MKILITGPISNFGGREVEVNTIIKALQKDFEISVLSTSNDMSSESMALSEVNIHFKKLQKITCEKFFWIAFFAKISWLKNKCKKHYSEYSSNYISKKYFKVTKKYELVLKHEIAKYNLVIFCGQVSSLYLEYIQEQCTLNQTKLIVRLTNSLVTELNHKVFTQKLDAVIIHSVLSEKEALKIFKKTKVIDQTCFREKNILDLKIETNKTNLSYGFIGRFTETKGIIPLINFFKKKEISLRVAGDGSFLKNVKDAASVNENIQYLGKFNYNNIQGFYEQIDVLIIPSDFEGGPLVAIEAMASGKIIISTKVGAMEDRLNNSMNNFWMKFDDFEKSLSEQIEIINNLDENEILNIKKSNRQIYIERYSNKTIYKSYLSFIKSKIDENRSQPRKIKTSKARILGT